MQVMLENILKYIFIIVINYLMIICTRFLQVYGANNELDHYIDGLDTSRSNWMRYVNPAINAEAQNLVACQHDVSLRFTYFIFDRKFVFKMCANPLL